MTPRVSIILPVSPAKTSSAIAEQWEAPALKTTRTTWVAVRRRTTCVMVPNSPRSPSGLNSSVSPPSSATLTRWTAF